MRQMPPGGNESPKKSLHAWLYTFLMYKARDWILN